MDAKDDIKYMEMALREAQKAADDGEVPTGCVIVDAGGRILGRAHNQTEGLVDATAHAEMLAITQAAAEAGDWRLTDCALYVTKEPCPMCGGAIVLGRLALVAWAASDPKRGAHTVFGTFAHPGLNHRPATLFPVGGPEVLAELQGFFRDLRRAKQEPDSE